MGPIAGLAAGLGLAALASHFGFGEALANMMMIGLLVMGVLLVIGFVMRKRAAQGAALAGAGGAAGPFQRQQPASILERNTQDEAPQGGSLIGSRLGGGIGNAVAAGQPASIPAGFDTVGFAANAKGQFMALQAANDAGDLASLREFLTPEMFALVQADIAERGQVPQRTEVYGLDARVLAVAEEESRYVASVRFTGSVRDEPGSPTEDLDETWHLTKPRAGLGGWVIAGIQQNAA
jgi:predicted lipid-binding transport protein (Tim44 family)